MIFDPNDKLTITYQWDIKDKPQPPGQEIEVEIPIDPEAKVTAILPSHFQLEISQSEIKVTCLANGYHQPTDPAEPFHGFRIIRVANKAFPELVIGGKNLRPDFTNDFISYGTTNNDGVMDRLYLNLVKLPESTSQPPGLGYGTVFTLSEKAPPLPSCYKVLGYKTNTSTASEMGTLILVTEGKSGGTNQTFVLGPMRLRRLASLVSLLVPYASVHYCPDEHRLRSVADF